MNTISGNLSNGFQVRQRLVQQGEQVVSANKQQLEPDEQKMIKRQFPQERSSYLQTYRKNGQVEQKAPASRGSRLDMRG